MFCNKLLLCFSFVLLLGSKQLIAQDFYDLNTIQTIEIYFNQPDWDYQLDTANSGTDGYILAHSVKINGVQLDSVGVKYKGNSSYDSSYTKNPIHIALDEFKNQSYQNYTDIKLGNNYADPSMIREVLSYHLLANYMDCPQSNFARLYINGVYIGLYANDESINKDFCLNHFYSKKGTFIKCNPQINPGPNTKSNLKYIAGADSSSYFNYYEIKSDYGWNDLVALCDSVTNHASNIAATFDMDKVIWMLAFNNVLVNLDSYSGVFCQNYYLYKDNSNLYNPIVWDLNMCLGGFPFAGNANNSMGSLTVAGMQQLSLSNHATDVYWPLINAVMSNASYKKKYIAHCRTIVNELFSDSSYINTATQLRTLIDADVQLDTNKFFSYEKFQNAIDSNTNVSSYVVPGIRILMDARASYLKATTDFNYTTPIITGVSADTTATTISNLTTIIAHVTNTNANAVYLAYRYSVFQKFTSILMYDDGTHTDSIANDNTYAVSIPKHSDKIQYYIYAENNSAGIFSPERAAHEFYTLNTNSKLSEVEPIVLYPNPANKELTIIAGRNNTMPFEIVNAWGELVYQAVLSETTLINIEQFTRGIYFIRTGSTVKKLIIMHP